MKAIWKNVVIAEALQEKLIKIEGNWYFPPDAVNHEYFRENDHHTICIWKGEASYYDVIVDGVANESGAWYYPQPKDGSIERVKKDYTNYVAFWNGIEVVQ